MNISQTLATLDEQCASPAVLADPAAEKRGSAPGVAGMKVAYVASRFPKITETFILYEMQAVEALGVQVELYPLWREPAAVMHDEARRYVERAHFERLVSLRTLAANAGMLLRRPASYLAALGTGVMANWGSPRYLAGFLASFPKAVVFARDAQKRGVQHVHAHFASHPAAVAWVIHRLTGIGYSFTAHGSDLHRDQHMLKEKVAEASMVVAISEYNRRLILEHCGPRYADRVRVIHCGTDTQSFCPASETRAGERTDGERSTGQHSPDERTDGESRKALQIACIGTLHEVKGQTHLIAACALLRERGVPFQLHLIGDGPDESALRIEADSWGIHSAVIFHGRCTRRQVAQLLSRMDVVVAPSVPSRDGRREGIPVALMEAMSAGVPVVASSLSGIPELVVHHRSGVLVPPGDSAAIAEALERLAREPAWRRQLAAEARQTVQRDFDQRRCAEQLVLAIRDLQTAQTEASLSDSTHAQWEV